MKLSSTKLMNFFLNLLSIKFKTISLINLKIKSLKQKKYDDVVIVSVDNLSFGGTGKTSMVIEIGKHLKNKDIKFAIVSRGYKSKYEKCGITVASNHTAKEVGDEAKLLKLSFPDRDILIGKNRHNSIKMAIKNKNRVIILDDGFQSTDISKDIKIMLFNSFHPYYYLRNFKFLMESEDYILTYSPDINAKNENVNSYHFERKHFYDSKGNIINPSNYSLFGFSALGDNWRFKNDMKEFNLVGFKNYKDHYAFTKKDIYYLDKQRKRIKADYLLCTEKEYVKLMDYNLENIPLIYVKNVIKFNIDLIRTILKHAEKNKTD